MQSIRTRLRRDVAADESRLRDEVNGELASAEVFLGDVENGCRLCCKQTCQCRTANGEWGLLLDSEGPSLEDIPVCN